MAWWQTALLVYGLLVAVIGVPMSFGLCRMAALNDPERDR